MNGIIVYDRDVAANRAWYIGKYTEAFEKRGISCRLVCTDEIDKITDVDFAIVRVINPDLSRNLEKKGIRVFNSSKVSEICNDKYATYKFVDENKLAAFLPVIDLAQWKTPDEIADSDEFKKIDFPCVLKSKSGHGGTEVFWIGNKDELIEGLCDKKIENYLLQKTCSTPGIDVRVYVIGDRIIAAMKRMGKPEGDIHERFRSNYCLGGSCSPYDIYSDSIMLDAVKKITKAIAVDFVGIDFIFHDGKPVFNEIEDVVGARMIYDFTDIDIVDLYVEYIAACDQAK